MRSSGTVLCMRYSEVNWFSQGWFASSTMASVPRLLSQRSSRSLAPTALPPPAAPVATVLAPEAPMLGEVAQPARDREERTSKGRIGFIQASLS